jgi:hypothetical protein
VNTGQQQHRNEDECGRHKRKIGRLDRHISNNMALSHEHSPQSSRDQFCNLHMGLQDEIYDGWDKGFFYRTTSDDLPGVDSICTTPLVSRHAERRTWNAASLSALALTSMVTSWIADDAGHNHL